MPDQSKKEKKQRPAGRGRVSMFGTLRRLACAAVLVSMSIVCGKYLAFGVGNVLRFSLENLPILLGGILLGPVAGTVIGVAADLIGCVMVGYTVNPAVTLGAAVIGLSSGLLFHLPKRLPYLLRVSLAVIAAHLLGSVLIKTPGLAAYYDMPLEVLYLWRLLNYTIVAAVELPLSAVIARNKGVRSVLALPPLPTRPSKNPDGSNGKEEL